MRFTFRDFSHSTCTFIFSMDAGAEQTLMQGTRWQHLYEAAVHPVSVCVAVHMLMPSELPVLTVYPTRQISSTALQKTVERSSTVMIASAMSRANPCSHLKIVSPAGQGLQHRALRHQPRHPVLRGLVRDQRH